MFAISRVWAALVHLHTHASTTGQTANDHHNQSHSSSDHTVAYGPVDADYLVGTANATLTGEIAVGTTPGGELGGTWASPTIDATHSGSAHHTRLHSTTDTLDHSFPGGTTTFLRADGTYASVTATPPVLVGPNNLVSTVEAIAANTYVHVGRQLEISATGSIEIPATSTLEITA